MTDTLHKFDDWIQDDSAIGAVVMRQHLETDRRGGRRNFSAHVPDRS